MTDNKKIKANFQENSIKVKDENLLKKRDVHLLTDINLTLNTPSLFYRSNNDDSNIMKPMSKFKPTSLDVNTKPSQKLTNYLMKQNVKNSN